MDAEPERLAISITLRAGLIVHFAINVNGVASRDRLASKFCGDLTSPYSLTDQGWLTLILCTHLLNPVADVYAKPLYVLLVEHTAMHDDIS